MDLGRHVTRNGDANGTGTGDDSHTGTINDMDTTQLLTAGEVAELFRVDPKTVGRWARIGRLRCIRTLGGHRRYFKTDVDALLAEQGAVAAPPAASKGAAAWDAEDVDNL